MKGKIKLFLAIVLVLTMSVSQIAMAKQDDSKGNDKDWNSSNGIDKDGEEHLPPGIQKKVRNWLEDSWVPPGWQSKLRNYTEIDGNRIRVNNRHVPFDTPPVIKDGRTLIPIRAVTEAMDGDVYWEVVGEGVATIISPDGLIKIDFYLSEDNAGGVVQVYLWEGDTLEDEDGNLYVDDPDPLSDDWDLDGQALLDVLPGLYNDRTYVPLRFIAEVFGLKVLYDPVTGQIDISSGDPIVMLSKYVLEYEDIEDGLTVYIDEANEAFIGLELDDENLVGGGVDYTTQAALEFGLENLPQYATDATLVLTIDEDVFDGDTSYEFIVKFTNSIEKILSVIFE